jgi:hypothetical protein
MLRGLPAMSGLSGTLENHNKITNYKWIEFHSRDLIDYGILLSITKRNKMHALEWWDAKHVLRTQPTSN